MGSLWVPGGPTKVPEEIPNHVDPFIQPEWILVPNSSGTHGSHPNLDGMNKNAGKKCQVCFNRIRFEFDMKLPSGKLT